MAVSVLMLYLIINSRKNTHTYNGYLRADYIRPVFDGCFFDILPIFATIYCLHLNTSHVLSVDSVIQGECDAESEQNT